jgi:hypothetical protein
MKPMHTTSRRASIAAPRRRGRRARLAAAAGCLLFARLAAAETVRHDVSARVALPERSIVGSVVVAVPSEPTLPRELVLHLFPNRFRADGDEVDDITRPYVYPYGEMVPGGIRVTAVERLDPAPRPAEHRVTARAGMPPDTVLEIPLGERPRDGGTVRVRIDFETTLPERYGPFGVTEYGLTAVGGWYPYLAARRGDGTWAPELGPAPGAIRAAVEVEPEATVVLGEAVFAPGHPARVETALERARNLDLVVFPAADRAAEEAGASALRFVSPTPRRAHRIGSERPEIRVRELVASAVAERPPGLAAPPELTVVEVPLRWNLSSPSDAAVVVSDRSLHVQSALRGFHDAQIAQAVYARLLRDRALACESTEDRGWVLQAVAWELAERLVRKIDPQHRDVYWWTSWFDVFAIVDRFEKAPKLPFVTAFFENARTDDELRESVFTYAADRAPARLAVERLERRFGDPEIAAAVDRWLEADARRCTTFAAALADATGRPPDEIGTAIGEALAEPPPAPPHTAVDESLRPEEERSRYQLVLDSAEVEVSSSEFGLAGLFVARERYDYTKDVAINPYYSDRSVGGRIGPRVHFGERNDATTYRHNLFGFFNGASLRRSFRDDRFPEERDEGTVLGFGLRYDYSNVYWFDEPSRQRHARLFVDWYDHAFGSDFGFVRFGGLASATTPLIGYRTIGAVQLLAGFEQPLSDRGVPLQEQFSLGGHLAIRGIPVEARLARNIGLARFELRQHVYPEWDLDLFDTLTFRRPYVRGFVDTGQVDDSAGRALNPEHWAAGAGIGLGAVYEFLGFFPGLAYVEIATRLDRDQDDVQVLFGTRQAF